MAFISQHGLLNNCWSTFFNLTKITLKDFSPVTTNYILISAVKQLIVINHIQNKSWLHVCVYCVYLLCIYKYTHACIYLIKMCYVYVLNQFKSYKWYECTYACKYIQAFVYNYTVYT